ncbi:MAG: hypothetical protein ABIV94_01030 [Acidimicrobiales bacterium]
MSSTRGKKLVAVLTLAAVVLLAGGGLVVALLRAGSNDNSSTATSAPVPTATVNSSVPPLSGQGAQGSELDKAVAAGRMLSYHGLYSVTDERLQAGTTETLEIWRKGPSVRTDVIDKNATEEQRSKASVTGSTSIACNIIDGAEQCSASSSGPIDLPTVFVRAVAAQTPLPTLTGRDVVVAGMSGRCYAAAAVGELCLRADGLMLRSQMQTTTVELTSLDAVVTDDVFILPVTALGDPTAS